MKNFKVALTTALFLFSASVMATDLHMVQKLKMGGQEMKQESWLSGHKIKSSVEGPMGQMVTLLDIEAKSAYMLMPAQKKYMQISLDQITKASQSQSPDLGEVKVEKTGKKEEVNGFHAEEYKVTSPSGLDLSVWVTKDLDVDIEEFRGIMKETQKDAMSKALANAKIDGIPVKTMGTITQRGQKMTIEADVESADTKAIPAATFALPTGYEKIDMGNPFGGGAS